jgi:hypothetical protein
MSTRLTISAVELNKLNKVSGREGRGATFLEARGVVVIVSTFGSVECNLSSCRLSTHFAEILGRESLNVETLIASDVLSGC